MNYLETDTGQVAFLAGDEVPDKQKSVSRICLYTVFGESPFRDQKMKIQLVNGCELWGEMIRYYGASVGIIGCRPPWELPKSLIEARPLGTVPFTSFFSSC